MGWFRRQQAPASPPAYPPAPALDLASALDLVLVKAVESQANTAAKIGQLVTDNVSALAEMQQRAFTRSSRRRGGNIRARSAKRTKGGQFTHGCRLCDNPAISNPTKEEIIAHINHETPGLNYRIEGNAVHVDVAENQVQTTAQGDEVIECDDCAKGIPHQHGQH